MQKIAHLADIHIQDRRRGEYAEVFKKLYASLREDEPTLVVVAGDIFDNKMRASAHNLEDVAAFLTELTKIAPVVIIAGNHDTNCLTPGALDLLTPLVADRAALQPPNLTYWRGSGVYKAHGMVWTVIATDGRHPEADEEEDFKTKEGMHAVPHICLFHEEVTGALLPSGAQLRDFKLTKGSFDRYDLTMGGHIHLRQKITPRSAYCGSLVQQTIGEAHYGHGYVSWQLIPSTAHAPYKTEEPTLRGVDIKNDQGFVRVLVDSTGKDITRLPTPQHPRYWEMVHHEDAPPALVAIVAESYETAYGMASRAIRQVPRTGEMPQAEMAGHVTKASWMAEDATRVGDDIARAMRIARSGRPGPVHITLPADVLNDAADVSAKTLPRAEDFAPTLTLLDHRTADDVLDKLSKAKRPMLLTGASLCRSGGPELLHAFQEQTGVPAVGMESPRGINDPSLGAFAEVLAQADLLVLVGKPLDFTLRFGNEPFVDAACKVIQLDPEMRVLEQTASNLGDSSRLLLAELTDAVPALERLTEMAAQKQWDRSDWCDEVTAAIAYRPAEWNTATADDSQRRHPAEICRDIQTVLDESDDAVFISDGGEFGQWAQACIRAPQRVINGTSGSIGSVIPFAMAARVACPDARIVATLGDGTFGFQPAEFDTAVRYNLPFTAVVGNDACWNAEHQIQLRDYGPDRLFACDLLPTPYDAVVRDFGGHGESVSRSDDLVAALNRTFDTNKPACADVALERTAAPVIRRG